MKKIFFLLSIAVFAFLSCEDVIEVETPTGVERLVFEAILRADTTEAFVPVEIRVTKTSNFFDAVEPVSDLESLIIVIETFEDGISTGTSVKSMAELVPGSGIYEPDPTFDADQRISTFYLRQEEVSFTMIARYQGRVYSAESGYQPSVPVDGLALGDNTLFEEEETELIVSYTDLPDQENFYIFDFGFGNFLPTEDTFYQGQAFQFSYFYDQIFESGTELEIGILGADRELYNYMNLLITQSGDQQGPFQTPVATVRGNIFDITDLDNQDNFDNVQQPELFPLGYFAVVQEFRGSITID